MFGLFNERLKRSGPNEREIHFFTEPSWPMRPKLGPDVRLIFAIRTMNFIVKNSPQHWSANVIVARAFQANSVGHRWSSFFKRLDEWRPIDRAVDFKKLIRIARDLRSLVSRGKLCWSSTIHQSSRRLAGRSAKIENIVMIASDEHEFHFERWRYHKLQFAVFENFARVSHLGGLRAFDKFGRNWTFFFSAKT